MVYLKDSKLKVQGAGDVAKVFRDLLSLEDRIELEKEHFYVMQLDVRSQIKMVELVSIGILTSSLVHPRETYRRAVVGGRHRLSLLTITPQGKAIRQMRIYKLPNKYLRRDKFSGL